MIKKLVKKFKARYGAEPDLICSAPGRVNLIGEHTDYNLGFVLPMAIDRRVWVAGRKLDENVIRMSSENQGETIEIEGAIRRQGNWADYPLGVIYAFREQGQTVDGLDMHFWGDVPLGGGLSSSAAIEVANATLITELCDIPIKPTAIARLCQVAENSFVGVRCGIMDQMAATFSEKDHALYIDCRDQSYETVPLELGDYRFAVINSGVGRELVGSGYNRRRSECEKAASELGIRSLRELDADDMPRIDALPSPLNCRVRHVVSENHRVEDAVVHLRRGELEDFGTLMNLSHQSLRDDYRVSTPELDYLVENAQRMDGVLGARLTGAGFGGCVIALVHKDVIKNLERYLLVNYRETFDKVSELIVTAPDGGARIESRQV